MIGKTSRFIKIGPNKLFIMIMGGKH